MVKSALYSRFGVSHYWIADPDLDRIEVFRLGEDGSYELLNTFNRPEVLQMEDYPELKLPLEEVFA